MVDTASSRASLAIPGVILMPAMKPRDMPGAGGMGMPMAEMAAVGVEAAIDRDGVDSAPVHKLLVPSLVVRESSGPPPDSAP